MSEQVEAGASQEASLDEIRDLFANLPGPNDESAALAAQRQEELTKPAGSLGRLEDLAVWMARWQGRSEPQMERPRVAVFAGNHGVTARGVSAFPAEATGQVVHNVIHGGAAINQLAGMVDADLRVYELALEQPTEDFTKAPAMSEEDCARAICYGMMSVEEGFDAIALGEIGIGNTTSGAAMCLALFGGAAEDWVGRGTGVDDEGLKRKIAAVEAACDLHRDHLDDPLEVMRRLGGLELAAILGAVIAARVAQTPVILDGFTCSAAAAIAYRILPSALDHCVVSHRSAEPGHMRLMEEIKQRPLLDLGMRLGEASGAALALNILKAAAATHNGMATFAEAGVSTRR